MPFEQERHRPPQRDLPPRQSRTKYIIHIPDEEPKREHDRARAEEIGNGRLLLGGDALGGRGELEDVGYAEGGEDDERGKDDLVVDRISVYDAAAINIRMMTSSTRNVYKRTSSR